MGLEDLQTIVSCNVPGSAVHHGCPAGGNRGTMGERAAAEGGALQRRGCAPGAALGSTMCGHVAALIRCICVVRGPYKDLALQVRALFEDTDRRREVLHEVEGG